MSRHFAHLSTHAWLICLIVLVASALTPSAGAAVRPAFLVKDINTAPNPYLYITPGGLTAVGNAIYFVAKDARNGEELWKSDATGANAMLLKDITPGTADSYFGPLLDYYGTLLFSAVGELWTSDGTAAGTVRVKSFAPIPQNAYLSDFTVVNGMLFFVVNGAELWKSDGTTAGTLRVTNIALLNYYGNSLGLLSLNGMLYFAASDGRIGYELWKSDGTAAGTVRVQDINHGSGSSNPASLAVVGETLFFTAYDGHSTALWMSDGTAEGTLRLKDLSLCSESTDPPHADVNGTLFFAAFDTSAGCELWKSDGTTDGTMMVKDLAPGLLASSPHSLTSVGGKLFFIASGGNIDPMDRVWTSDGTAAGTSPVTLRLQALELANLNGTLFVNAFSGTPDRLGLWKTNGTDLGTVLVKDIRALNLVVVQGTLFFIAGDEHDTNQVLWRSDGTSAGTVPAERPVSITLGAEVAELTDVNGTLYFAAETESAGNELWKSDGTAAGTVMIKDIFPGETDSYPRHLTKVGGTLFFIANDANGGDLWKSDGTAVGTIRVKDFPFEVIDYSPYFGYQYGARLIDLNGTLYFVAYDENTGTRNIWKSDGTEVGTVPVTEINAAFSGVVVDLAALNGTLFFATSGGLWRTDGTRLGTTLTKTFDIPAPSCSRWGCYYPPSSPGKLTKVGGRLFFRAYDAHTGYELYTSDGTAAGTRLVKDISPGIKNSNPDNLVDMNGTLFFSADDGVSGRELWKSDGSTAGTRWVVDLAPGAQSATPAWLAEVKGTLFFTASDGVSSFELWRSDGTQEGTTQVVDLAFGNSNPTWIVLAGENLFFSADDGVHGQELWAIRAEVDTYIRAPIWTGVAPGGDAAVHIDYGNLGLTSAKAVTLTATLDPALTFLGDTSGITPTVTGQIVTWQLSATTLDEHGFALYIRAPNAALGATYPVTLTLTAAGEMHPVDNAARVAVTIARQVYLPAVGR